MRTLTILGSTGSVGTQALDVVTANPDRFRVHALAAGGANVDLLAEQIFSVRPDVVAVSRPTAVQDLQLALYAQAKDRGWSAGEASLPRIVAGPDAVTELAGEPVDVVLNAITGSAGLNPTLAALDAGSTLALANKESLVIGGRLVTERAREGQLVAVDSEHSALAQCLRGGRRDEVARLVLTASGGPFRGRTREQMQDATPAEALAHPTWDMGLMVTTNSASMVNKALEVLEAHLLFGVPLDRIAVTVHPQSIVHSMVEFTDGSTLAQCSPPDMRLPIALGLGWPDRVPGAARPCDWTTAATWTFEPLDDEAFPAVEIAKRAGTAAGTAPAVYNAANEACVEAFHAGRIGFLDIVDTVESVLSEHLADGHVADADLDLQAVLAADSWARDRAASLAAERPGTTSA